MDAPAGVTQEQGHTRFPHLPSAALALIFITRRIQRSLSLVDREVNPRIDRSPILLGMFYILFYFILFYFILCSSLSSLLLIWICVVQNVSEAVQYNVKTSSVLIELSSTRQIATNSFFLRKLLEWLKL